MSWPTSIEVRAETPADASAVRALLLAAFRTPTEADLIDSLRQNATHYVALVAETGEDVLGHIAFSEVAFDPMRETVGLALGLAPLAVSQAHRRFGAGAKLVEAGLAACRSAGAGLVVVLGDPAYYGRFGFGPAASLGLRCFYQAPPEAFQAIALRPFEPAPGVTTVLFRPEFDVFG